MKKYIFLLLLSFYQLLNAQPFIGINSLTVTQLNADEINVNLNVNGGSSFGYIINNYSISNNIISLSVCYFISFDAMIWNDVQNIPVTVPINGNYSLVVTLYDSTSVSTCNYNSIQDSATLQFSTPLASAVSLAAGSFDSGDIGVRVTPNPTHGLITLDFGNKPEAVTVSVANTLGQEISRGVYAPVASLPIMIEGASGVYFVTVSSSRGSETFKVVKQ